MRRLRHWSSWLLVAALAIQVVSVIMGWVFMPYLSIPVIVAATVSPLWHDWRVCLWCTVPDRVSPCGLWWGHRVRRVEGAMIVAAAAAALVVNDPMAGRWCTWVAIAVFAVNDALELTHSRSRPFCRDCRRGGWGGAGADIPDPVVVGRG